MRTYQILFKRSAVKDIRKIPQSAVHRIQDIIDSLKEKPIPEESQKIHGYEKIFRIRIGSYRIIYEVDKIIRIITIIRIGHRKDVYKKL